LRSPKTSFSIYGTHHYHLDWILLILDYHRFTENFLWFFTLLFFSVFSISSFLSAKLCLIFHFSILQKSKCFSFKHGTFTKTRQASSSNSQQLNVIIRKSRNKYETNWHETTTPHTHKNMLRGSFSIHSHFFRVAFYCTSHCFVYHTNSRSFIHTHTHKLFPFHPFPLLWHVSIYDCAWHAACDK
jgi:hypothetical protein